MRSIWKCVLCLIIVGWDRKLTVKLNSNDWLTCLVVSPWLMVNILLSWLFCCGHVSDKIHWHYVWEVEWSGGLQHVMTHTISVLCKFDFRLTYTRTQCSASSNVEEEKTQTQPDLGRQCFRSLLRTTHWIFHSCVISKQKNWYTVPRYCSYWEACLGPGKALSLEPSPTHIVPVWSALRMTISCMMAGTTLMLPFSAQLTQPARTRPRIRAIQAWAWLL